MVELSVIIVTYNSGELVLDCLNSIAAGAGALSHEIIVVDNASTDGTPERIRQAFPGVQLIISAGNNGFGAGNNRGFQASCGEYIAIINPDLRLHPGALESMANYLRDHPGVGIVGPRTYDETGAITFTARRGYTVRRLVARSIGLGAFFPVRVYGRYRRQVLPGAAPFDVDWLQGACLLVRRAVYEAIGGFDEGFFLYMEDVDLCARAREAGWRVVYLPAAEATHVGSATVSRYPLPRVRSYHISPLYYYRKRKRPGAVFILKIALTVELLEKLVLRGIQLLRRDPDASAKARAEWTVIRDVWRY